MKGVGVFREAVFFVAVGLGSAGVAADLSLAMPVDCALGVDCYVQNYVDRDPGPGVRDVGCGALSYDGHKGTDFALPSFAAMEAGMAVRAAAPGVVRGVRDGMPDLGLAGTPEDVLAGKDCGNGVVIDHGDGWETQYCHLAEGSVAVARGQRVAVGAKLGEVGYSGRTEFPHLHLSVRHDGAVVDPFGPDMAAFCPGDTEDELWQFPIDYVAGGIVSAGVSTGVPDYAAVKAGTAHRDDLTVAAPALVGWGFAFGGRAGDVLEITLTDPSGGQLIRHEAVVERPQAQFFRAAGKRRPAGGWQAGTWGLTVRLIRDGDDLSRRTRAFTVGE